VVEQGDFKYTYNETYGGYEVAPLEQKTSYNEIASEINGTPVVAVADDAFAENYDLIEIILPSSITRIGRCAFFFTNISSINLSNVTSIGTGAFEGCSNLKNITSLSANLNYIGYGPFNGTYIYTINYAGTTEQWNEIEKDENWNYNFSATINTSDGSFYVEG